MRKKNFLNSILQNALDSRLAYARILKTSDEKKAAILTAEKRILAAEADKSAKEKTKAALQQDYARTAAMIEEAGKSGLLSSKDKLTDKKMHAMEALSAVMNMNEGKRRQDESEKELAGIVTALTNVRKAMAGKESACGNAEREFSRIREVYLKLKESTYDWAKETRSKLKAGDICPVCGHTVDTVFSDDRFESLLKPVEEKYLEAENVKKEAESALNQAVAEEKPAKKAAPAKKPAKKAEKAETEVYFEFAGRQVKAADVTKAVEAACKANGVKSADVKGVKVYVKAEDNAAYYVLANGESGKIDL